jgi:mannitol-1-phosphate/altronate dehydrogenase
MTLDDDDDEDDDDDDDVYDVYDVLDDDDGVHDNKEVKVEPFLGWVYEKKEGRDWKEEKK